MKGLIQFKEKEKDTIIKPKVAWANKAFAAERKGPRPLKSNDGAGTEEKKPSPPHQWS